LALLAAAALAARLAAQRAAAFALVAWNPVLALHFAGGGHNDAWLAALVLAALAFGAAGRPAGEGAAWAAAALVKWIPLALVPLRALELRGGRGRLARAALGAAGVAAAIALLAGWRYGAGWLEAIAPLARNARTETEYAVPHRLTQLGLARWLALGLALAAFAAAYAWLLREAAGGRARLGLAAGVLLLTTPYLAPWYLAWLVPLAAAREDAAARRLSFALSAYLLPQTIPL
ncbi:MAG: DUF2029 domain-containing protein, partial [Thermoleophilia bacterium]|nr:DUF2029 domain-containing protein [Thermoleophilia bacterium]